MLDIMKTIQATIEKIDIGSVNFPVGISFLASGRPIVLYSLREFTTHKTIEEALDQIQEYFDKYDIEMIQEETKENNQEQKECQACQTRVKDWKGDDPKCAFKTGSFSPENWNCATLARLRKLIVHNEHEFPIPGIKNHRDSNCNENYATFNLTNIKQLQVEGGDDPLVLWMSWYKNHGRTQTLYLMYPDQAPRVPTEAECLAVIEYYENKLKPIDSTKDQVK